MVGPGRKAQQKETEPGKETLGDNLRKLRKAAHLTQVELAQRSGITQSSISRIEKGGAEHVRHETVARLANALRAKPENLTGDRTKAAAGATESAKARLAEAIADAVPEGAMFSVLAFFESLRQAPGSGPARRGPGPRRGK
jgi:transcriptional regulator with XRE-family HTH domain